MKTFAFIASLLFLTSCSSLPDTPIGNYDGTWGPVIHQPQKGSPYSCWNGETQVIVRGEANPDAQLCKPIVGI